MIDLNAVIEGPDFSADPKELGLWMLYYARKCQVCGVYYKREVALFHNPSMIGRTEQKGQRFARCPLHPHDDVKVGPRGWARIADNGL